MPYLIDGHNLIPRLPGLSLRSIDDELELVARLKDYCLRTRRRVEVFFDGAPPGHAGTRSFGLVTAHFVRQGRTADEAIRLRLQQLGKGARNWTVVSSDHQVQGEARAVHARVLSGDEFARLLSEPAPRKGGGAERPAIGPEELEEWLRLFGDPGDTGAVHKQD